MTKRTAAIIAASVTLIAAAMAVILLPLAAKAQINRMLPDCPSGWSFLFQSARPSMPNCPRDESESGWRAWHTAHADAKGCINLNNSPGWGTMTFGLPGDTLTATCRW
jgi:hypothetical protein